MQLQHIKRWPPAWKAFLPACCCKNESEMGLLAVTSPWGYQHGFSAETSRFLSDGTPFYDLIANSFANIAVIETMK